MEVVRDWIRESSVRSSLCSGAIAQATAKTVTAPMSRVTILLQTQPLSLRQALLVSSVRDMWRGNLAAVLQKVPYGAISYGVYEGVKISTRPLWSSSSDPGLLVRLAGGFLSGCTSTVLTYPLDVVRAQMAVHGGAGAGPGGLYSCLQATCRQGAFRGLGLSVVFQSLNVSLVFGVYETIQSRALQRGAFEGRGKQRTGFLPTLVCTALAGVLATTATFPLDLLRRRMQLAGPGVSAWHEASAIVGSHGVRGLWRGLLPGIAKVAPTGAVSFWSYEFIRQEILCSNIAPR